MAKSRSQSNKKNRSRTPTQSIKNYDTGCCGLPRIVSGFIDPSFVFVALILIAPAIVLFTPINKRGDPFNDNHVTEIKNYFLNPVFLCCISLWFLFELLATIKGTSLSCGQLMTSRWYLINGLFFHCLMDWNTGVWQNWSLMTEQYDTLDPRWAEPFSEGGAVAVLTGIVEFTTMTPTCLIAYVLYNFFDINRNLNKRILAYTFEIMAALLQFIGTVYYYAPEFMNGFKNTPYYDKNYEFTLDHIFYWWFGVGVGLVWIIVPLLLIYNAISNISTYVPNKIKQN